MTIQVSAPPGAPSGAAGGDLSGTYPNPTIAGAHGVTPGYIPEANAEGNVVAVQNYALRAPKNLQSRGALVGSEIAAGTYVLLPGAPGAVLATSDCGHGNFSLNPAKYAVGGRTLYLRLEATCIVNETAPAANFAMSLCKIKASKGGSGAISLELEAPIEGSTVEFATPAKESGTPKETEDFAFPAAGLYVIKMVTSAKTALASKTDVQVTPQWRAY